MSVKVQKWKDGWYVVIHYKTRRHTKKCETEALAHQLASVMESRINAQGLDALESFQPKKKKTILFGDYSDRWLRELKASARKTTTISRYESCLRVHLRPEFDSVPLEDIDYVRLKEFCIEKAGKLSRDSVRLTIATMRIILKEAVREGIIKVSPATDLGQFFGERVKEDADPLTRQEVEAVLEKARSRYPVYYEFVLCLTKAGLRFGEAKAVQWPDIEFRQRRMHIRRNWPVHSELTVPKTARSIRNVDMTLQLKAALLELRARRKQEALARGENEISKWVFLSNEGKPINYFNFRNRVWTKILEKADVRGRGVHQLRHTYATHLLMAGASPIYVSRQLGHSQITTTMNVYAHWIEEQGEEREVDRLDYEEETKVGVK